MKKFFLGLLFVILLLVIGGYFYLQSTVKNYTKSVSLTGLNTNSEVIFDNYGIPHIYADNNEDAFRMLGYVQASDRLFQLELLRRVGSGRLSEILGKETIPVDKYIRTVGLDENAKRAAIAFENEAPEEIKRNVYAFIDGINQYIKEENAPIEFTIIGIEKSEFTLTDIYRILGYMGFGFSMELKNEPMLSWINNNLGSQYITDLHLDYIPRDVTIPNQKIVPDTTDFTPIAAQVSDVLDRLPVPIFYGSNSWVISGKKSKSGKVLFANDTHIGLSQPSVWYEAHIETPDLKIYGNFLAGIPYPLVAHNMHHSWGLTIFPADATDLYSETIKDNKVLYKNEWVELQKREETIMVKGQDPVTFNVTTTPHGPIISELDKFSQDFEKPVSMWFVANKVTDRKLYSIASLSTSHSFEDFEKAARDIDSPGLNIMYGDIEGNIGWYGGAKLIQRPNHVQPKLVLDGATGKDDALGFYDFSYNPRNINPENGYVVSANNQPDSINGVMHKGYYYAGARYKAISEAIEKRDDWDIDAMKTLVMSDKSPIYPNNIKEISAIVTPTTETEKEVLNAALAWGGEHGENQVGPTIYYKMIYHILQMSLEDEMSKRRFDLFLSTPVYLHAVNPLLVNESSVWWDDITTTEVESRSNIVNAAFTKSVNELTAQLGNDVTSWNWNKVHFIEHIHPIGRKEPMDKIFNVGPFPAGGGEEVINKIAFSLNGDGIYKSRSGPAMRILLDFDDIENSISINPTGASGNVMNPHYDDQAMMYVNGEFRKQKMVKTDILKDKEGIWSFTMK
jgi:penicillin amidase